MKKMQRNDRNNIIPALIILAEILAGVACFLAVYLHLPAQRYKSALRLGKKYLNEMNYDEAVNMYHKAVSIEPEQDDAYIGLGQAYTAKADSLANAENTKISDVTFVYDEATDAYQKVIDLDQENTDGYYYQAEVYTKAGDAAKSTDADLAANYYQLAIEVYGKLQTLDRNQVVTKEMTRLVAAGGTDSDTADTEPEPVPKSSDDKLTITLVPHSQARGEFYNSDVADGQTATIYSETYSTIRIDTEGFDALKDTVKDFNDTTKTNADQAYKELSGEYGAQYTENIDVLRADAKVFSFVEDVHQSVYPDSDPSPKFWNFDSETGDSVTLNEVLSDTSDLPSLLMDAIPDDTDVESLSESSIASDLADDSLNWGIGYDGLHVLLADQKMGANGRTWITSIEVTLRFEDYPNLFTDTFQSLPSSYGMPLENNRPYTLTFASDGSTHTVEVMTEMSEDDYIEDVSIELDGMDTEMHSEMLSFEGEYQIQSYYLHMEDGRDFLYLNGTGDSDISTVWAIRLDNGVQILGTPTDYIDGDALEADSRYLENPSRFLMVHRMNLLGTHYVYRYCRVGEDGRPAATDALYDCQSDLLLSVLRAKTDVPVQLLNTPGGKVTGNGIVSAGTYLYFHKTDGLSFADFVTSDGQAVRITSNTTGYPHTTNGIDEKKLFDGIGYAG